MVTIIRAYLMYKPMRFFTGLAVLPLTAGVALGIRYIIKIFLGTATGNIQSLILCSLLIMIAIMIWVLGMMADVIAANRKISQEIQMRTRDIDYRLLWIEKELKNNK